jgi:hypothetical protein
MSIPLLSTFGGVEASGAGKVQLTDGSGANGHVGIFNSAGTLIDGGTPAPAEAVVTYSATPVFDLSVSTIHNILLTGNVTSSTVTNPTVGLHLFVIRQDATGGWTFVFPVSFKGAGTISAAAGTATLSTYATQLFAYLPSTSVFVAVTPLMFGE